MSEVLVTGSKGFIGQNVLRGCEEEGFKVRTLNYKDILDADKNKKLKRLLSDKVMGCEYVFHVGARTDTKDFSSELLFTNYYITKLLVNYCKQFEIGMIFSSSQTAKGKSEVGYPENIYGWSKYMCEDYGLNQAHMAYLSNKNHPFKFIALRYVNVHGPGEELKGNIASIGYNAWKRGEFDVWDAKRDFIYVDDVVSANLYARTQPSGIYEVGDIGFSVMSVFDDTQKYVKAKEFDSKTKIALYHGSVFGSQTDFGFILPNSDVEKDIFDGYDMVLLGDIHKRQYLNDEKTIAYPGSLIQQNFGEDFDKGFLVWDIDKRESEFINVSKKS